jgi:signal peptidase I
MDFAFALFGGLVITGGVVLWDRLQRPKEPDFKGKETIGTDSRTAGIIIEYARAFFPVILVVFVLRSFIVEPFRIPSGSMLPSLYIGDFILVSKFSYGIRLPLINQKVFSIGTPKRGEVLVFRYPHDEKTNYIKRVVGLPGDIVDYKNKRLRINGNVVDLQKSNREDTEQGTQSNEQVRVHIERLGKSSHGILLDTSLGSRDYTRIVVPPDKYFVMGDNRDHSNDSRFWGFVPEENIVGRAFFVWFSWDSNKNDHFWNDYIGGGANWPRIGTTID